MEDEKSTIDFVAVTILLAGATAAEAVVTNERFTYDSSSNVPILSMLLHQTLQTFISHAPNKETGIENENENDDNGSTRQRRRNDKNENENDEEEENDEKKTLYYDNIAL